MCNPLACLVGAWHAPLIAYPWCSRMDWPAIGSTTGLSRTLGETIVRSYSPLELLPHAVQLVTALTCSGSPCSMLKARGDPEHPVTQ